MEFKNTWETYSEKQIKEADLFSADYRNFLDEGKTERECVDFIVNEIEAKGYREVSRIIAEKGKISMGDKVYAVCM